MGYIAKMKFAIYARVSTDAQSQYSTEDQIQQCKNFIRSRDGEISAIYKDEAISGSDISRYDYQRLKADAYARKMDAIVVDDLSRIGRDVPEFSSFYREINDLGIILYGVSKGIDTSNQSSKIPLYFKGIMNEVFLDDLKAKIVRGLKGQFLRGYSTGGRIYGYTTKQILDPSGAQDKFSRPKRLGCEILVNQKEAKIVKKIFEMKHSGLGLRSISKVLNGDRIPSPHAGCGTRSGLWSSTTIRGILKNKRYIGAWEYNKTRWIKKRVLGKRRSLPNPKDQWESLTAEKLRIVSDDLFYAVNGNIKSRKRNSVGCKKYLLSGLLKCGECGASMIVINSGRYSCYLCTAARTIGPEACSNKQRISRRAIESAFLTEIQKTLLDKDILARLVDVVNQKLDAQLGSVSIDIGVLQKRRNELESRIEKLLDGLETNTPIHSIQDRLRQREMELEKVKNDLARARNSALSPEKVNVDWVQQKVFRLKSLINDHKNNIHLLRNELRNLIPDRLMVSKETINGAVQHTISGNLNPFSLVAETNQYLSKIAVQGLEPLLHFSIPIEGTWPESFETSKKTG